MAEAPSLQHNCWGNILFCLECSPPASFHQFDWPRWWCRPRGIPAHLRSLDQSHRGLYSTALQQEDTKQWRDEGGRQNKYCQFVIRLLGKFPLTRLVHFKRTSSGTVRHQHVFRHDSGLDCKRKVNKTGCVWQISHQCGKGSFFWRSRSKSVRWHFI